MSSHLVTAVASHGFGVALGYLVDRAYGEPPNAVHPMIAVGHGLGRLEAIVYGRSRARGAAHLGVAVSSAVVVGRAASVAVGPTAATAAAVALASSSRMLTNTAVEVERTLHQGDLGDARQQLRSLVGRDPSKLDEAEISRAVIESVAENTVDGVTASLFWGLAGGAPAVLVHRVSNTLDAMVGHRNERYQDFGWASARADDFLNWVPARLTAGLIAVVSTRPTSEVLAIVGRDGGDHPSPNGGRVEAAVAGAIDVTLGGPNDYGGMVEVRGQLGDGRRPTPSDITAAVGVTRRASDLFALFALSIATCVTVARSRRR